MRSVGKSRRNIRTVQAPHLPQPPRDACDLGVDGAGPSSEPPRSICTAPTPKPRRITTNSTSCPTSTATACPRARNLTASFAMRRDRVADHRARCGQPAHRTAPETRPDPSIMDGCRAYNSSAPPPDYKFAASYDRNISLDCFVYVPPPGGTRRSGRPARQIRLDAPPVPGAGVEQHPK